MRRFNCLSGIGLYLCFLSGLQADQMFTWSASPASYTLSGSADFSVVRDGSAFDLVIAVNNTAPAGVSVSSEILTGLYFNIAGPSQGALEMMSAVATDGLIESGNYTQPANGTAASNICAPGTGGTAGNPACSSTIAGGWESGYWSAANNGYHYGIGTSGLSGAFNGNGTTGAGQVNYGIVPFGSAANPALVNPNTGITNQFPYTDGLATFVLAGLTTDQISIAGVSAEYGTAPEYSVAASQRITGNESGVSGVPEPATIVEMVGATVVICGWFWRRTRRI